MAATKDTIYIEADDEITTVIEKIVQAKSAIIAVVLPKRATVFQSVVNMKLLKKAASETKHKIVLITSDASIESIASVAGLHIAQSLSSKPFIPKRKSPVSHTETITPNELESATSAPLTLEQREAVNEVVETDVLPDSDTIEIDNTEQDAPAEIETVALDSEKKKARFKIPDFSSFRLKMTLGIVTLVLLVSGWFVGFVVMPKAVVAINADTENRQITLDLNVDASVEQSDVGAGIVAAKMAELLKENKSTVEATGEKNTGEKATGTVTFSMKDCSVVEVVVPSGTFISSNGLTYITTEEANMQSVKFGNSCRNEDFKQFSTDTVGVVAQQSGENYNRVAGAYSVGITTVTAFGSEMVGGTTNLIKVVSAADIQKAKDQLKGTATADATNELKAKHEAEGRKAMVETLVETEPIIKSSKEVDAEAAEVTVTQTVTYKMLGVTTEDLAKVLDAAIEKTFAEGGVTKTIRSNGLDKTTYILKERKAENKQVFTMQTVAVLGAIFDENAIKNEVVGKKRGDIEKLLESRDGVRSVSVEYSPFWVTTTPKKAEKITVVVNEVSGE